MKKLIILVASASLALFSCNKESIDTTVENNNKGNISVVSGSDIKYKAWELWGKCWGSGVTCVEYPVVIIKPKFAEVMTPLEVQAFFATTEGTSLLQGLDQSIQAKLTSGNYAMELNYEDQSVINYRFYYNNDVFVLQFHK